MAALAAAAAGVYLLVAAFAHATTPVDPSVMLCVLSGWLGFLGGTVLYWLVAVAEVPRLLLRCRDLRMTWIDPAHTPAIENLCRLYAYVAAGLAFGVVISEVAVAFFAESQRSVVADTIVLAFPVLAAAIALYVGIQPYVTISRVVRRHVDVILHPALAQMASPPGHLLTTVGFEDFTKTYQYFRSLKRLPIKTANLVQYFAGIMASLLIYFLQNYLS